MALNDEVALLSMTSVFKGFERDALRRLALSAQTRVLKAGEILYRENHPAEGGFVILSGQIKVESAHDHKVFIAGTGDVLGELSLMVETNWPSTATIHDTATVMRISRPLMLHILGDFPHSAAALRDMLAQRLMHLGAELEEVYRALT